MPEHAIVCLVRLDAPSAEGAIRALARELQRAGVVKDTFEAAAVARERRSPTGLPFEGGRLRFRTPSRSTSCPRGTR